MESTDSSQKTAETIDLNAEDYGWTDEQLKELANA